VTILASISAILRRAVSAAASCSLLSSRNRAAPPPPAVHVDEGLRHPAFCLRHDVTGPETDVAASSRGGSSKIVRDQAQSQDQESVIPSAARKKTENSVISAEPFALHEAPIEEVRQDGQHRARRAPTSLRPPADGSADRRPGSVLQAPAGGAGHRPRRCGDPVERPGDRCQRRREVRQGIRANTGGRRSRTRVVGEERDQRQHRRRSPTAPSGRDAPYAPATRGAEVEDADADHASSTRIRHRDEQHVVSPGAVMKGGK